MIGSLRGKIIDKNEKFVILEVGIGLPAQAGVGYKVALSPDTLTHIKTNTEVFLYIHTHVREDAFDLYGFLEMSGLEFFEMLLGVSGIGPKGALAILSVASVDTLKRAIKTNDLGYLNKISGIGKKTAEKMVIELRDKIGNIEVGANMQDELDALEALKSLGYSQNDARNALKSCDPALATNAKIKQALKILGK
ncbi:MAG: Holliday junction branch migration protein RuvA [bacterium]|nr:Holliday junction branch migration protein RuvA [bacterium]